MTAPIYLLRHGETVSNKAGRMQGQTDSPLTTLGRVQAAAMGEVLAAHLDPHRPIHLRYSPLGRVRQTLAHVIDAISQIGVIDPIEEPRLKEIAFGTWSGMSADKLRSGEHSERWQARQIDPWSVGAPGGETYQDLADRVAEVLHDLRAIPDNHQIILVCHGGTGRMIRGPLTDLPKTDWPWMPVPQNGLFHIGKGALSFIESHIPEPWPSPARRLPTARNIAPTTVRLAETAETLDLVALEQSADARFAANGICLPEGGQRDDTALYADCAERGDLWLAHLNGEIVGFLAVEMKDGLPFLHQVSVHGDHGGKGIGTALMAAAMQQIAVRGCERMTLTTFEKVGWNGPWYRSMGFQPIPENELGPQLSTKLNDERSRLGPNPRIAMEFWF